MPRPVAEASVHVVEWDDARHHPEMVVSGDCLSVRCSGTSAVHRVVYGKQNWTTGKHFFSVRVTEPGPNGYIMVGVSNASLVYKDVGSSDFPGRIQNSGASVYLYDGHTYYSGANASIATGGAIRCSIGVLVEFDNAGVGSLSFFINGSNNISNGPISQYKLPAGGGPWYPVVTLYQLNSSISSEFLDR